MIIILSIENDFSTLEIGNWLTFYKVNYKVLYTPAFLSNVSIEELSPQGVLAYIEKKIECAISEVKVVW